MVINRYFLKDTVKGIIAVTETAAAAALCVWIAGSAVKTACFEPNSVTAREPMDPDIPLEVCETIPEPEEQTEFPEEIPDTAETVCVMDVRSIPVEGCSGAWCATREELELTARIVWLEARGEESFVRRDVTDVIFNRLHNGHWGSSLADVIFAVDPWTGLPEFETAPMLGESELDSDILAMVRDVFANGVQLAPDVMYFSSGGHATWDGYVPLFEAGNMYFGRSEWLSAGEAEES